MGTELAIESPEKSGGIFFSSRGPDHHLASESGFLMLQTPLCRLQRVKTIPRRWTSYIRPSKHHPFGPFRCGILAIVAPRLENFLFLTLPPHLVAVVESPSSLAAADVQIPEACYSTLHLPTPNALTQGSPSDPCVFRASRFGRIRRVVLERLAVFNATDFFMARGSRGMHTASIGRRRSPSSEQHTSWEGEKVANPSDCRAHLVVSETTRFCRIPSSVLGASSWTWPSLCLCYLTASYERQLSRSDLVLVRRGPTSLKG